jgi:hypothetical protein
MHHIESFKKNVITAVQVRTSSTTQSFKKRF